MRVDTTYRTDGIEGNHYHDGDFARGRTFRGIFNSTQKDGLAGPGWNVASLLECLDTEIGPMVVDGPGGGVLYKPSSDGTYSPSQDTPTYSTLTEKPAGGYEYRRDEKGVRTKR